VNNDGKVYQRDLGPKSLAIVRDMTAYNPGKGWQITNSEWPRSTTTANQAVAVYAMATNSSSALFGGRRPSVRPEK
jgi:hypothetical protein